MGIRRKVDETLPPRLTVGSAASASNKEDRALSLDDVTSLLPLEPFRIFDRIDSAKRYQLPLDPTFPLAVKLHEFPSIPRAVPMTWHERLEIFCPLGGHGEFRVGEHLEPFEAGDILLIDNLRLHGVEKFEGPSRCALVVVFYPNLIAAPGALPCDMLLLRPFHHFREGCLRLPHGSPASAEAWRRLHRLVQMEARRNDDPARQTRQKLALSELLLVMQEALRDQVGEAFDHERRRAHLRRLSPLLDHVHANISEPITVTAAARLLHMSAGYFRRFFRNVTGMTFSAYVEHLRVSRACQLLMESDLTLAQIAAETGFYDQSHLCRHIRRRLGKSPGQIRQESRGAPARASGQPQG